MVLRERENESTFITYNKSTLVSFKCTTFSTSKHVLFFTKLSLLWLTALCFEIMFVFFITWQNISCWSNKVWVDYMYSFERTFFNRFYHIFYKNIFTIIFFVWRESVWGSLTKESGRSKFKLSHCFMAFRFLLYCSICMYL